MKWSARLNSAPPLPVRIWKSYLHHEKNFFCLPRQKKFFFYLLGESKRNSGKIRVQRASEQLCGCTGARFFAFKTIVFCLSMYPAFVFSYWSPIIRLIRRRPMRRVLCPRAQNWQRALRDAFSLKRTVLTKNSIRCSFHGSARFLCTLIQEENLAEDGSIGLFSAYEYPASTRRAPAPAPQTIR